MSKSFVSTEKVIEKKEDVKKSTNGKNVDRTRVEAKSNSDLVGIKFFLN